MNRIESPPSADEYSANQESDARAHAAVVRNDPGGREQEEEIERYEWEGGNLGPAEFSFN